MQRPSALLGPPPLQSAFMSASSGAQQSNHNGSASSSEPAAEKSHPGSGRSSTSSSVHTSDHRPHGLTPAEANMEAGRDHWPKHGSSHHLPNADKSHQEGSSAGHGSQQPTSAQGKSHHNGSKSAYLHGRPQPTWLSSAPDQQPTHSASVDTHDQPSISSGAISEHRPSQNGPETSAGSSTQGGHQHPQSGKPQKPGRGRSVERPPSAHAGSQPQAPTTPAVTRPSNIPREYIV